VSTADGSPGTGAHAAQAAQAAHAAAEGAERRWAWVVAAIIFVLVAMMVFTGVHWAAMPPSRVETVDPRTLHVRGEFAEANLGTGIESDGRVVVRLVAQQYSFTPQCIVVPAGMPVTFRGTASDAVHGFIVGATNANVMLIPGFVASFTTRFNQVGEQLMPCHEYCGTGHEGMWGRVRVVPQDEFQRLAEAGGKVSCVAR